jgi:hypothetical protein
MHASSQEFMDCSWPARCEFPLSRPREMGSCHRYNQPPPPPPVIEHPEEKTPGYAHYSKETIVQVDLREFWLWIVGSRCVSSVYLRRMRHHLTTLQIHNTFIKRHVQILEVGGNRAVPNAKYVLHPSLV